MTTLSVIVPVHNGERYLEDCLESILAQTWADFEVLCVDDGSTDSTPLILAKYQERDPRVKVLTQSAQGAAQARNMGIERASGNYLLFLDADDFFSLDMFEAVCARAQKTDADIVLFGGRRYDQATGLLSDCFEFLFPELLPRKEVFKLDDAPQTFFRITTPAPWSKLFKASFVRSKNLRFQSLPNSNDLFFVYMAMALADRVTAVEGDYVRYRVNTNTGIQDTRQKEPLCFLAALEAWRCALCEHKVFQRAELSFVNTSLSVIKYNIETVRDRVACAKILDYLADHEQALGEVLCHPDDYYQYFDSWQLHAFIVAAMRQRERMRLAGDPVLPQVVVGATQDKPLVSIIVPVYNAMPFIRETIESLIAQSMGNFEIICVNDGSTDGSLEEVVSLASGDGRIKVLSQPNQGLSCARNAGLDAACGTYVYFMDSDDLLVPTALEELTERMESQDLDVLYFDAESFFESDQLKKEHAWFITSYTRSAQYDEVRSGAELLALFQANRDYIVSACMYMTRRETIESNSLRFIRGIMHEDNAFTFSLGLHAERAAHLKRPLFKRRVRSGSIMTTSPSFAKSYGYFACGKDMARQLFTLPESIDLETRAHLGVLVAQAFQNARNVYAALSEDQYGSQYGLLEDFGAFGVEVREPAERMRRTCDDLAQVREEVGALRGSLSFRLGRVATKPLRWLRDMAKRQS